MAALSVTPVLPVPNLAEAVAFWTDALGVPPTFVDGDRWAEFRLGDTKLALAGTDRAADEAGVMLKVDDLDTAADALAAREESLGPRAEGAHEVRAVATAPGGHPVVFYEPLPRRDDA
ncbi:MAG: bleomycin resistance protein [Actinobacteria bacterium]|nr:bleomycin resistance protein [Actinomycetota bacterium]